MIRVVLAIVTATAVLGTTIPVLDAVRDDVTADRLAVQGDRLERTATALAADSTAVDPDEPAARRTLTLTVPGRSLATARADPVAIGCPSAVLTEDSPSSGCDAALVYGVAGEPPVVRRVRSVDVVTPNGPLRLSPGEHRLVLRYVERDGGPVVQVTRG